MGRTVDLTDKLGLAGKPTIRIGETTLVVNDSAANMLRIMEKAGGGLAVKDAFAIAKLLFEPSSAKALDKLDLSLDDYMTVIEAAIDLVVGEQSGEAGTPATTP